MTEAIFKLRAAARAGEVGLFPTDDQGFDLLRPHKLGKDLGVDVHARRNPKHHRLFFAILKFLQEHSPKFDEVPLEKIKDAVKIACGLVDRFIDTETGQTFYVLRSMSFASMDQTAFREFFDSAVEIIARRWMPPGTTPEQVRKELEAMVDGPGAIGTRRPKQIAPAEGAQA